MARRQNKATLFAGSAFGIYSDFKAVFPPCKSFERAQNKEGIPSLFCGKSLKTLLIIWMLLLFFVQSGK